MPSRLASPRLQTGAGERVQAQRAERVAADLRVRRGGDSSRAGVVLTSTLAWRVWPAATENAGRVRRAERAAQQDRVGVEVGVLERVGAMLPACGALADAADDAGRSTRS